jgi:uncharacterized protein with HEPN domain
MPVSAQTYLFDIQKAIELIREFTQDQSFEMYQKNVMMNSAVERQLSIIGEAIVQLLKLEPNVPITSARQITGFRNILIHNYARVSPAVVWTIVQDDLETLYNEVTALLAS